MFRIRRVTADPTPANVGTVTQVQQILREQFPGLDPDEVDTLPEKLRDPVKLRFRPVLLVAEDARERVRGFALLLHAPDLRFCYLDFVAAAHGRGGGVGAALYERVREEATAVDAVGVFFECLPDDPALCRDPEVLEQNAARLRFYERWGARPIANTAYETPTAPDGDNPPYLCLDTLGAEHTPTRAATRRIVRAILERKYAAVCPPGYMDMVIASITDDPIKLRAPRYVRRVEAAVAPRRRLADRIPLVINDRHDIHHMRDRGYVEAPVRVAAIRSELEASGLFEQLAPKRFADEHILAVHDSALVDYLRRACAEVGDGRSVYPYIFPIRNQARPPKSLPLRSGYFCIDTFTPINGNAWKAARRAVDCTLTAAERVLEGQRLAYALVRPPGQHAERRAFGGFCYFNHSAIAAHFLSRFAKVAVLDIDYHHGNGTQDIFYERRDVLTVSLHGHPEFAYPYFSGFAGETGQGPGAGYNLNIPLPEQTTPERYREALGRALKRIARHRPGFLVVAAGFDTAKGDPTGSWNHVRADFTRIGQAIGALGLPTLVVQEGGYRVRTLGQNVRAFFEGLAAASSAAPRAGTERRRRGEPEPAEVEFRNHVRESDVEAVRSLIAATGVFNTAEIAVAEELVQARLASGDVSGYHFVVAEQAGRVAGYACFGPVSGTDGRFDLYWIAVDPAEQRTGLGARLMREAEAACRALGARRLYAETSGTPRYDGTRRFYRRMGFRKVAEIDDFYRDGDAKVVLEKTIEMPAAAA